MHIGMQIERVRKALDVERFTAQIARAERQAILPIDAVVEFATVDIAIVGQHDDGIGVLVAQDCFEVESIIVERACTAPRGAPRRSHHLYVTRADLGLWCTQRNVVGREVAIILLIDEVNHQIRAGLIDVHGTQEG